MDIFKLPVHPQADIFPMLPADEMKELAQDIKQNGLQMPIIIGHDEEGELCLIDGRNRRRIYQISEKPGGSLFFEALAMISARGLL